MSSRTVAAKYINKGDHVTLYGTRNFGRSAKVLNVFKFKDHVTIILSDKRMKPLVLWPDTEVSVDR